MPKIHLPVFEGPLDLLLQLIERDDLDITAVSLVAVADQYLQAIRGKGEGGGYEPRALAEFIAIGAKLIYLKSKALLPRPAEAPSSILEEDDVGRELVDLLQEYRRYAEATDLLEQRQLLGLRHFTRTAAPPILPGGPGLDNVTVEAMRKIMLNVLRRVPAAPKTVLTRDVVTLRERIGRFRLLLATSGRFSFRQVISECGTRVEVVVAFLAILELLKSGECDAHQSESWGDIDVVALTPVAS